ncbi:MAG: dethiobiotin synthase [Rikenellaceae bacterium]
MEKGIYFISGIDTDAGKSYATGILARRLMDDGNSVITQKFIQTGGVCENGMSLDINIHREIMGCGLLTEDLDFTTAPVIFTYPASPHLAAEIDSREIDFKAIERSTEQLSALYDYLFIEGAGGLCVPLKGAYTTADYVAEKGLKTVLVTSGKLGSINHTILTFEACKARGIEVAAVLYNHFFSSNNEIISTDTFNYLKNYINTNFPNCEIIEIEQLAL